MGNDEDHPQSGQAQGLPLPKRVNKVNVKHYLEINNEFNGQGCPHYRFGHRYW